MTESHSSELFRYVRIRGTTRDAPRAIEVIDPPASSTYRRLVALPGDPESRHGLPVARGAAGSASPAGRRRESVASEPQDVDFFIGLGEALASGEGRRVLNKARGAGVPDAEQVAALWDRLAETLLDPARHAEADRAAQGLRAAWLCDRIARTDESPTELTERARCAVVHLQPLPEPADAARPLPATPDRPARPDPAERLASLRALERFVSEVRAAPALPVPPPPAADTAKRAERPPLPADTAERAEPAPLPGDAPEHGRAPTMLDIPAEFRHDLSGLSAESQALAGRFGGEDAPRAVLVDNAQEEIARLAREIAADAPAGSRLVVSGGIVSVVPVAQRRAGPTTAEHGRTAQRDGAPAATKCPVRISGVADFLRVEQTLVEYQAGELADIVNVLQGEMKERLTRSLTRSELTIVEESERIEESEREESRTNSFKMELESEKALTSIVEKANKLTGLSATIPGVGTFVVDGSLGQSSQTSQSEMEKSATTFSQTVTSRALDQIKTRTAQARTSSMLREIEDSTRHVLDNRDGGDHVVAAARWVDKHYSAQVMSYGARIALEIVAENPPAFLRPMQARRDILLPEPPDGSQHAFGPLKSPRDVTRANYAYFAGVYGADVDPPPRDGLYVSKAEAQPPPIHDGDAFVKGEITIPAGYESIAVYARGELVRVPNYNYGPGMRVFINNAELTFAPNAPGSAPLIGCTGTVAYAISSWTKAYSMTIAIECRLSQAALEAWQIKTYRRIREAWDQIVRDAENKAAQEQVRQGVVIQGRNPLINEELIRGELKKSAIWALCVGDHFWLEREGTEVCKENGTTLPLLDEETCGKLKLASLLESAIDWKLMTYQLLPYYWGNVCDWQERLGYADPDPLYAEFLRAGAARIIVPLASGRAAALELLYFLHTGQRWTGSGEPPLLCDPDGLSAYLESMTIENGPPTQVGDAWTVVVPTTLTVLECASACVDGTKVAAPLRPAGKKAKLVAGVPVHAGEPHRHNE